ncbi:hypothetical protein M9Y10_035521 [Tritrichomonas musculus]|uniref:Protein kinase domain-containing protein n=1 Tax=Tritrichomonas musculus TaxID=1915356 RepID=A0ABR2KIZ0_9EUKA
MTNHNQFVNLNEYKILNFIGDGAFSNVFMIKCKKTRIKYAAKVIKLMVDEDTRDDDDTLHIFREVNLISILNYPSILKFIGYSQTNFDGDPNPTIITEYATNGSLKNIIEMEKLGIPPKEWNETKKLINIYGIASGMSYMHKYNVINRDLKPENILIDDYLYPKISDFGLSKILDTLSASMNIQSQKGLKGTPIYIAPEIFSSLEYSKASDIYAFAFIVYEVITLNNPVLCKNFHTLISKIIKGERPHILEDTPDVYRDLIERCWSQEASMRPSFDEIVEEMKSDDRYINDLIDEDEFYN